MFILTLIIKAIIPFEGDLFHLDSESEDSESEDKGSDKDSDTKELSEKAKGKQPAKLSDEDSHVEEETKNKPKPRSEFERKMDELMKGHIQKTTIPRIHENQWDDTTNDDEYDQYEDWKADDINYTIESDKKEFEELAEKAKNLNINSEKRSLEDDTAEENSDTSSKETPKETSSKKRKD